jgi:chromosome segregation ATPase
VLHKKFLLSAISLSLLTAIHPIQAKAAFALAASASQWQSVEETDAYLQAPVCRAFTKASNSAEAIELSLSFPKDGKLLPMIALKTNLAPGLVAIRISSDEMEYFFPLRAAANNQETNLYWYAPLNFTRFEQLVRDSDSLNLILDPKGAATPVKVSLKGSGNALDAAKKCLTAAKVKVPEDFFKLLNTKKEEITPNLGDRTPAFLFQNVQEAFNAYQAGQLINVELSKLRKANEPLLSKEKAALAVLKNASATFASAKSKLDTATTLVSSLTTKLADSKTKLAALQSEKPLAEADLAAKKAIYLPLKAQMVPYEQNVTKAAAAVKNTADQIEDDEHTIAHNNRLIPDLESESSALRRQIPSLEQRVRSTRSTYDDADSVYRRYDVRRETENFLSRVASYGWATNDYQAGERDLRSAQMNYSSAQSRLSSAEGALRSCQATPNANCSAQQSAVSSAQSEVQQASSAMSSAQSKMSGAKWRMDNAQNDASRKANSESDRLRRNRDDAASAYSSASSALSNAQNRIAEIRSLIPRLRAQIAKAEVELPGLRTQLSAEQTDLAARTSERDQFSQSIGYGVAEANFTSATNHLKEVNDGIAATTKDIPKITKDLAAAQKSVPGLTKSFTQADADLKAAQVKLAPISEQLKPFRALEKVQLDALEVQDQKFKNAKASYQALYLELIR